VNYLFLVYLSLLHPWAIRQLPHLEALWQLAPLPEHSFLPVKQYLIQFQQWTRQLTIDAYWLLDEEGLQDAIRLLKNPPTPPTLDADANLVENDLAKDGEAWANGGKLHIANHPKAWLIAKLRIPLSFCEFNFVTTTEIDERQQEFIACRYLLKIKLGAVEIQLKINAAHRYSNFVLPFYLTHQREEIAQQIFQALSTTEISSQAVEEISCLVCYALQILALTERLEVTLGVKKGKLQNAEPTSVHNLNPGSQASPITPSDDCSEKGTRD
jgi:hypothetical protein